MIVDTRSAPKGGKVFTMRLAPYTVGLLHVHNKVPTFGGQFITLASCVWTITA